MSTPREYAINMAKRLQTMSLIDFVKDVHLRFYPEKDISFTEYLLDLTNYEGQFIVEHYKLVEFGIMTSAQPSSVSSKLVSLHLIEQIDYIKIEPVSVGASTSHSRIEYLLTPEAFKKCLLRARRYANQSVDPTIYCEHYILIEKVLKLYADYVAMHKDNIIAAKDNKIAQLNKIIQSQRVKIEFQSMALNNSTQPVQTQSNHQNELKSLIEINMDQSSKIDQLVAHAAAMNEQLEYIYSTVGRF